MAEICEASTQPEITYCSACMYLRKCRACYSCTHPNGLKEPKPSIGTFCCYGARNDEHQTDK